MCATRKLAQLHQPRALPDEAQAARGGGAHLMLGGQAAPPAARLAPPLPPPSGAPAPRRGGGAGGGGRGARHSSVALKEMDGTATRTGGAAGQARSTQRLPMQHVALAPLQGAVQPRGRLTSGSLSLNCAMASTFSATGA